MGYYTGFELYIDSANGLDDPVIKKVENAIKELNIFEPGGNAEYGWSAYTKWYDYEEDMRLLSYRFPDVVFELHGDGEESEDVWTHYYKGGRVQTDGLVVTYTYHKFDESKLQPLTAEQLNALEKERKELEEYV